MIIMTSNLGAEKITNTKKLGFGEKNNIEENKLIMNELKREFKPEFINRIDNIVIFNKLSSEDLVRILDNILKDLNNRLKDKKINLKVSEETKKYIIRNEIDLNYGARQLKRKIQEIIENVVAQKLVEGKLKEGCVIEFYIVENKIYNKIC